MQSKICKWQILWRTSNFNLIKNVSFLKTTCTEYQWVKLDKNFFNFRKDLFLCLAYIPPSQSIYANNMQQDLIDLLENDLLL